MDNGDETELISGFCECWRETLNWQDNDFLEPTILDVWNLQSKAKQKYFDLGQIKLIEISESDFELTGDGKTGLSPNERRHLQISKVHNHDKSCWIDRFNLKQEMSSWIFPLHFIDFETAMTAIPFNCDKHPYEGIAFQFSHHIIRENGQVEHVGQYLNAEPGIFPNFDFIRALKHELENDNGSIFRYAMHENSYLRTIHDQLPENSHEIADSDELCSFIDSITEYKGSSTKTPKTCGFRNMIDMCELVKRYFYDPSMKGSNSIKKVLPAVLNSSGFLQDKYSKPIYGSPSGIPSLNYQNKIWVEFQDGHVRDPYKLFRKMFEDMPEGDIELASDSEMINEGGAAATAYARMQSEDMSVYERLELRRSLLEYCELDTLAMVMLYEGWKDLIDS